MEKKIKIKRDYKDVQYKVYTFRLHDNTVKQLKELRGESSWNKFFKTIIDEKIEVSCYFCGSYTNLERHHIVAIKDGGGNEEENIMMLCPTCHKKTNNWGNKKLLK